MTALALFLVVVFPLSSQAQMKVGEVSVGQGGMGAGGVGKKGGRGSKGRGADVSEAGLRATTSRTEGVPQVDSQSAGDQSFDLTETDQGFTDEKAGFGAEGVSPASEETLGAESAEASRGAAQASADALHAEISGQAKPVSELSVSQSLHRFYHNAAARPASERRGHGLGAAAPVHLVRIADAMDKRLRLAAEVSPYDAPKHYKELLADVARLKKAGKLSAGAARAVETAIMASAVRKARRGDLDALASDQYGAAEDRTATSEERLRRVEKARAALSAWNDLLPIERLSALHSDVDRVLKEEGYARGSAAVSASASERVPARRAWFEYRVEDGAFAARLPGGLASVPRDLPERLPLGESPDAFGDSLKPGSSDIRNAVRLYRTLRSWGDTPLAGVSGAAGYFFNSSWASARHAVRKALGSQAPTSSVGHELARRRDNALQIVALRPGGVDARAARLIADEAEAMAAVYARVTLDDTPARAVAALRSRLAADPAGTVGRGLEGEGSTLLSWIDRMSLSVVDAESAVPLASPALDPALGGALIEGLLADAGRADPTPAILRWLARLGVSEADETLIGDVPEFRGAEANAFVVSARTGRGIVTFSLLRDSSGIVSARAADGAPRQGQRTLTLPEIEKTLSVPADAERLPESRS